MKMLGIMAALGFAFTGWASGVSADPWKDESGKGRERGGYARYDDGYRGRDYGDYGYRRRYADERIRVPRGHLPPPGECRTWYPGRPAGHQPPPYRC
jgi:hypothetical protein